MEQTPSLLTASLIAGAEAPRAEALRRLERRFGPVIYWSAPLDFGHAEFYEEEMGPGLTRRVAAFEPPLAPHRLAWAKRVCQAVEDDLRVSGRRRVNIDPGLLGAGGLFLATRKPQGHRLALEEGLYAELTLFYHQGGLKPLPWTYQDYASGPLPELLERLRARHLWALKTATPQGELDD